MIPDWPVILRAAALHLTQLPVPDAHTGYELAMVASLLRLAATDYDDAAAIRAAELGRVNGLLARGDVTAEADLDAAWRALIDVHATLEERDDTEAAAIVDDIWRLIRDRVEQRGEMLMRS